MAAKKKHLKLATHLHLPLDAITETFAFLAKRGAGKTYAASVLVEELLKAKLHVVVIDPMGAWFGLRSSADGKGPGLEIAVLGGEHGDLPLEPDAGEIVADLVVDDRVPCVLDVSSFTKGERKRFVTAFAERLYRRNRAAMHLVLEEADLFAPQKPMRGDERMLGAVEDLVRRGRGKGIGITLITQRSAVLNKDVLTQTECLVALRTTSPHDRKAIEAWIDVQGDRDERDRVMASLPKLGIGEAWFWSPGWLGILQQVKIRKRTTFDSSATPKAGQAKPTPDRVAELDLAALEERMRETIERAEAEDPKLLRRRIAELEREVRKERASEPETVVEQVEVPVLPNGKVDTLHDAVVRLEGLGTDLVEAARDITDALQRAEHMVAGAATDVPVEARSPRKRSRTKARTSVDPPEVDADTEVKLRKGERKILETLARHYPMKVTRAQLGTLAGYAPSGGTFGTYFGTLRRHGLLVEERGEIQITQGGLDWLGETAPPPPLTTEELLDVWRGALRRGERAMLDVLVEAYPDGLTRDELGERAGYEPSGGTFGTYLGTLRRNGLLVVEGDEVRAADTLFLTGVPA